MWFLLSWFTRDLYTRDILFRDMFPPALLEEIDQGLLPNSRVGGKLVAS